MPENGRPDPLDVLRALNEHVLENTREVRALRDDLARIYGRAPNGALLCAPPAPGDRPAMPKREWTPDDVKDVIGRIWGEPQAPRKRHR